MEHTHHHHSRPVPDRSAIPGWGADLDRANRPAVPMERTPPRLEMAPGEPPQQQANVEIFCSPERPHITPLFGTGQPPRGLSGALRRFAYKSTENDIRHWLLLMLADRVDMVEGIGEDLARGKVPNVLAEMGIKAEWEHNRAGLVKKAAVGAAVVGVAYYLLKRRRA
ncbi:hypothetical protein [Massilia endophytica]|uniref:hypothetical protein n=1 Tax=Massilia endophytica TaxID=2899220 RepID=UPI001E2EA1C6|nr:hypothetical protein [Massilia endophytica]UGQ48192.1 hypothetical protein LSQ66_06925 [Massilia endophytica]